MFLPMLHTAMAQDRHVWDLGRVTTLGLSPSVNICTGFVFKPDGTKMYVCTGGLGLVREYNLATPWDVSTASLLQSFTIGTTAGGIFIRADGVKMYLSTQTSADTVREYTLSTPWNVTTAAFVNLFSVAAQDTAPTCAVLNPSGDKMLVVGGLNDKVYAYTLGTPWDVTSAVFLNDFSVAAQETTPTSFCVRPDGRRLFLWGSSQNPDRARQYGMKTSWDISTMVLERTFQVPGGFISTAQAIGVSGDGRRLYLSDSSNILQFRIG